MGRSKRKYEVFLIGTGYGCYARDYCKEFCGTTWAVSEKQAVNNVRYQLRTKDHPYGGPCAWDLGDRLDEGYVDFHYEAIEA